MKEELKKEMEKINWWHTFDFDGVKTQGRDLSQEKLQFIQLPEDLTGKTVLDLGAWDGYFSFEAERRGAKRVLAIDTIAWQNDLLWNPEVKSHQKHTKKAGFDFAHKFFNSKVESKIMDIEKLEVEPFDVVLCLGILYHLKDPYKMIRDVAKITRERLILETQLDANYLALPAMVFYPNDECNKDPDTWWAPNVFCVEEMLKTAGFKTVQPVSLGYNRGAFHALK